ncbi:hypothetical protein, partial [Chromobacterium amazonense]|uniref:hypothetical protein n=1 Tax=Chromobacterium amazonense TaxID=1382803 RepID=UPI0031F65125
TSDLQPKPLLKKNAKLQLIIIENPTIMHNTIIFDSYFRTPTLPPLTPKIKIIGFGTLRKEFLIHFFFTYYM